MSAGPAADSVQLGLRQIYIIPNWRGLGWLGFMLLLGLMAFVYNNNLIYWLCFMLISVFIVSAVHGVQSLLGLSLQFGNSQPVFAGDNAGFNLHIHNATAQARWGVRVQFRDDEDSVQVVDLAAQQRAQITLYQPAVRRGWQESPRLELGSRYPYGWYTIWSLPRVYGRILVYPKPAPVGVAFPEHNGGQAQQGLSVRAGDDFFGLRPYQVGDSLRQIHWRSVAKGQGLHSKQYAGGNAQELWLDYAQTPGHDREQRLSQLCRWILDAEQLGWRYGLLLPGRTLALDTGSAHCAVCLDALALFGD